ncbi:MAG: metallophosphoesterase family protein [Anaplasma sp.]
MSFSGRRFAAICGLAGFLCLLSHGSAAGILFSWSQAAADNKLSVRAVVSPDEGCPILRVNSRNMKMGLRAPPESGRFEDKVCESLLPISTTARKIEVGDRRLPDIATSDRRDSVKVAVTGDTGCRISRLSRQDCKSPEKWPVRKVLEKIAGQNADLVVHVGDYLYREAECLDEKKCDKHVYGDNSLTWAADWLSPLQSVSKKVAFIFVRGNHEDCERAYRGWFRYLDGHPLSKRRYENCERMSDSWVFDLKQWFGSNVGFQVYDSSSSGEVFYREQDVRDLRRKFLEGSMHDRGLQMFLLTHRPLWASYRKYGMEYYGNLPQVRAIGEVLPAEFVAVISGHIHLGQILSVRRRKSGEGAPGSLQGHGAATKSHVTQIISGNGGTLLEEATNLQLRAREGVESIKSIAQIISGNGGARLDKVANLAYRSLAIANFVIGDVNTFDGFGFCTVDISRFKDESGHGNAHNNRYKVTFHGIESGAQHEFTIDQSG